MTTVLNDFNTRVVEIDLYFTFLEQIIRDNASLTFPNGRRKVINSELHKVLKAHGFLILYNLMESSIKKSLEKIYERLTLENVQYKDIRDEMKMLWIEMKYKNFNQKGSKEIFDTIEQIANDAISMAFDGSRVISGNIDALKVREFASTYGFSDRTPWQAKKGNSLHFVKRQRNDLAHGVVSFAQCGKQHTLEDLVRTKKEVISYMRGILKNVDEYITTKKYLRQQIPQGNNLAAVPLAP